MEIVNGSVGPLVGMNGHAFEIFGRSVDTLLYLEWRIARNFGLVAAPRVAVLWASNRRCHYLLIYPGHLGRHTVRSHERAFLIVNDHDRLHARRTCRQRIGTLLLCSARGINGTRVVNLPGSWSVPQLT